METSKIVNALRRLWLFSPERREAIKSSKVTGGYKCCVCGGIIPNQKLVKVDHKEQVRSHGWDWDTFMERLFCPSEGLQIMCKGCHDMKSKEERLLKSAQMYCEDLEKVLFFLKGLYYRETDVHEEWLCFAIEDKLYDRLENNLRRVSEKFGVKTNVLGSVGFPYLSCVMCDFIRAMLEGPIGAHQLYDDEMEKCIKKFITYGKKGVKVKLKEFT